MLTPSRKPLNPPVAPVSGACKGGFINTKPKERQHRPASLVAASRKCEPETAVVAYFRFKRLVSGVYSCRPVKHRSAPSIKDWP